MRNPYVKLAVIIIIIGVAGYFTARFILNLPTPEEKTLVAFMRDFQRGDYDSSSKRCINGSFFEMLNNSTVIDTDGNAIDWKKNMPIWSDEMLRFAVETYVRPHLRRIEFRQLTTQHLNDGNEAVVHFYFDFVVHDYMSGGANLIAPNVYNGYAEGDCFLARTADGWLIERFEVSLVNAEGMDLKQYLHYI